MNPRISIIHAIVLLLVTGCMTGRDAAVIELLDPPGTPTPTHVLDGKVRTVIVVDRPAPRLAHASTSQSNAGQPNSELRTIRKFCSEPSPDVVSAISSAAKADGGLSILGKGKGSFGYSNALNEVASQIGKPRAYTVSLLRELAYRLCEASLNESMDGNKSTLLLAKFVDNMVALFTIEQLMPTLADDVRISTGGQSTIKVGSGSRQNSQSKKQNPSPKPQAKTKDPQKTSSAEDTRPIWYSSFAANTSPTDGMSTPSPLKAAVSFPPPLPYSLRTAQAESDTSDQPDSESSGTDPNDGVDLTPPPPDPEFENGDDIELGGPSIVTKLSKNRNLPPAPHVTKTVAFVLGMYITRAELNECLLTLEQYRISNDDENGSAKNGSAENDRILDAFINSCNAITEFNNEFRMELLDFVMRDNQSESNEE